MEGLNMNETATPIDYSILKDKPTNLGEAIEHTALVFSKGFDEIEAAKARAEVSRAEYVNIVVDFAKSEGMSHEGIVDMVNTLILKPALDSGVISKSTRYQYSSGLGKALGHGVAWYPRAFELPAIEVEGKTTRGRKKAKPESKAVTLGTVKVDRKARTVELKVANSTDIELFAGAVQAVQSEPGRIALFLNYCKASGWFDHEAEAKKRAAKPE